jgi:hypothetical protein
LASISHVRGMISDHAVIHIHAIRAAQVYRGLQRYYDTRLSEAAKDGYLDGKWVDDSNIFIVPWHVEIAARFCTQQLYYRKRPKPSDLERVRMIFEVRCRFRSQNIMK